jgi:GntR family transcriptional regulator
MSTRRPFLYEDVKRQLRRRLDEGSYLPGARIPSESDLVKELRVSAITIRRAVRDLSLEGLLVRRQGLGVFVAKNPQIVRSLTAMSGADEMRRAGVEPVIKELSVTLVRAETTVARHLRLARGAVLYRLERLLLGNGDPIGLDVTFLPRVLGHMLKSEIAHEFIIPLLVSHGIEIDHVDFHIEGSTLSEPYAALLEVPTGFAALILNYTPIARDGRPLLSGRTISRADRFSYSLCANPTTHRP